MSCNVAGKSLSIIFWKKKIPFSELFQNHTHTVCVGELYIQPACQVGWSLLLLQAADLNQTKSLVLRPHSRDGAHLGGTWAPGTIKVCHQNSKYRVYRTVPIFNFRKTLVGWTSHAWEGKFPVKMSGSPEWGLVPRLKGSHLIPAQRFPSTASSPVRPIT